MCTSNELHELERIVRFGDLEQLKPIAVSLRTTEAAEFVPISPLALLVKMWYKYIFINIQYRMCPAISSFPARHFYQGGLVNHQETSRDNLILQESTKKLA